MIPLIIILGPTATGKSDLAVSIAEWITDKKIGGFRGAEIISADSRQVYKGLDIGTGKITKDEMRSIPHYCLDIADPQDRFSVSEWKKCAESAINKITNERKIPIICGGTGFYIDALVNNLEFQNVDMDPKEIAILESNTVEELFTELKSLDPNRANAMNNGSDNKNKRRLIRSIMLARELGSVPLLKSAEINSKYKPIFIGITVPDDVLRSRIHTRLIKRLDIGMISEANKVHDGKQIDTLGNIVKPLSYERMHELGLEYRYLAKLLQNESSNDDFIETLNNKIWQFARRQKTWFRRNKDIVWFEPKQMGEIKENILAALK
jgi:tRNA dimethylallyltransferase